MGKSEGDNVYCLGPSLSTHGPQDSSGIPMYSFTANDLNLHVSRIWGSQIEIAGSAIPAAVVTVNGVTATRQGSLFRALITVANSSAAVDLPVTVTAVNPSGSPQLVGTYTGRVFVPKASESPVYNTDAEITNSSKFACQYNGLGWLTNVTASVATPPFQLAFDYYPDGRRARKLYYEQSGGTWTLKREHHYYYDQWLLLSEKVVDNGTNYVNRYIWGLDLAGRLNGKPEQSAGGIGGLLAMQRIQGAVTNTYLPIANHNGNIMAVLDADTGAIAAEYAYSPFGTVVAATGPAKDKFPLRFQSKYYDHETGFYYYGYRYYDPLTGKWLSRDPLGESGGVNLTGAFGNDPVNNWDAFGLEGKSAHANAVNDAVRQRAELLEVENDPLYRARVQSGQALQGQLITGTETIAGLNPVVAGSEALSGSNLSGEKLSTGERVVIGATVVTGIAGKAVRWIKSGGRWIRALVRGEDEIVDTTEAIVQVEKTTAKEIATTEGTIVFADKTVARQALSGPQQIAANRFFRGATNKSVGFKVTDLGNGGKRLEFFSPANNPGYGKLYVQEIDANGAVVREFKDTLGPEGLIERKWVHGES